MLSVTDVAFALPSNQTKLKRNERLKTKPKEAEQNSDNHKKGVAELTPHSNLPLLSTMPRAILKYT